MWTAAEVVNVWQVVELSGLLKNKRNEVDEMLAAAHAKDRENSKLWEQVRLSQ